MKAMFEFPSTLWASGLRAKPADLLLPDIPDGVMFTERFQESKGLESFW